MLKLLIMAQLIAPTVLNNPLPIKKKLRSTEANYIVLHYDGGGSYASTRRTLLKKKTGYHYYVKRDGVIIKLIDTKYQASHAGISYYNGVFRMNKYSIGICLENEPPEKYTEAQYKSTSWLISVLQEKYKDSTTKILLGHSDIAIPRGRKQDPGSHFDWQKLRTYIEARR